MTYAFLQNDVRQCEHFSVEVNQSIRRIARVIRAAAGRSPAMAQAADTAFRNIRARLPAAQASSQVCRGCGQRIFGTEEQEKKATLAPFHEREAILTIRFSEAKLQSTMSTITFDTLKFVKRPGVEAAGASSKLAEALAEAQQEV